MTMTGILALLGPLGNIIEKVVPDPNKSAEIRAEITKALLQSDSEFYKAASKVIAAEATGESWMQRNWRPLTMLSFVAIIVNNYIIAPYIAFLTGLFGTEVELPILAIPSGMWDLLSIGIGGYIVSRGVEKTVETVQKGGTPLIGSKAETVTKSDLAADREKLLAELRSSK